jgi:hypothetical protein
VPWRLNTFGPVIWIANSNLDGYTPTPFTATSLWPHKKAKTEHLSSIIIGYTSSKKKKRRTNLWKRDRISIDSSFAAILINQRLIGTHKLLRKKIKTILSRLVNSISTESVR